MKTFAFVSLFLSLVLHAGRFASTEALAVGPSTKKSFGGYDYPNLYDESIPMLWSSKLVYSFAKLLEAGREGKLDLGDTFPPEVLAAYKDKRLDVRGLEGDHGLSFNKIAEIVKVNADYLKEDFSDWEYVGDIVKELQAIEDADESDSLFLETFASIEQASQCVYGVLKDENNKRIIVVFRGSTDLSTRDWQTNLSAQPTDMKTPKLLRDSLKGKLKKRILVHRGFYEYIFDNKRAKGEQRYDMILDDIKPFVEDGYKIYVTGHSLGAALSSLLAFKLAGSDKSWIPKPVTCISFASPFVGTDGFRTAFTLLEEKGLIRYLRVTNDGDTVPTLPPLSLGRKRLMKHVGINLRLCKNKFILSHPNSNGFGVVNAMRNSIFKPWWAIMKYHLLPLHEERMDAHKDTFQSMYINDLYADKKLMGKAFKRDEL
mmetsp:Transcript_7298/g.10658  ORF Transcript_7298/g.10658 Transcript_7298/m.10658 type:complete len:429 (+) Transcript_7298:160-1446(+)|eukprot:CAMPEP_0201688334 /NCGR_PEP_ID=MMETSP0578-20130828/2083_1 /ASSEMBLY_ACC=CAM_ASM_000663 /TAXON_ID=267565 /ORGANISM="Skeletonema grethea, Strain CCMP 1804" /LENGTH=428 /DNA_ID=CAMNT_0048172607 /DNA_START=111 /DNA_END=1397 /DNA_ORIENTATION=+